MYAEHKLKVDVDWSTLPSDESFGSLGEKYTVRRPVGIPYTGIPDWFRSDPTLVDPPGDPLS